MSTYHKVNDSFNDREEFLDDPPTVEEWFQAWVENNRVAGHDTLEDLADDALDSAA